VVRRRGSGVIFHPSVEVAVNGFRIFLVDDDERVSQALALVLRAAGHVVETATDSTDALARIVAQAPDVVVLDLMMPVVDGFDLCVRIRQEPALAATRIVVVSGKAYDADRRRALELGADAYLVKPVDATVLADTMARVVRDRIEIGFWGVRGTLPASGPGTHRYGGNTSCVSMRFPKGQFFIFDAGTGIKALSDRILSEPRQRLSAKIFISHPHWDHINAIPFFAPLYMQGHEFEILGATHGDLTVRELIAAQMESVYFPITIREFASRVYFRDLKEQVIEVDGITVRTKLLNHPGNTLGFRIEYGGRSLCYVTDNELYLPDNPHHDPRYVEGLVRFVADTDILITDTCYTDAEYPSKVGWGHSSIGQVARLAHDAAVRRLCLFHHDPDQDDDAIDAKLADARAVLSGLGSTTTAEAPAQGTVVEL
jgi:CheY-like chemotaxis protein